MVMGRAAAQHHSPGGSQSLNMCGAPLLSSWDLILLLVKLSSKYPQMPLTSQQINTENLKMFLKCQRNT